MKVITKQRNRTISKGRVLYSIFSLKEVEVLVLRIKISVRNYNPHSKFAKLNGHLF